MGFFNNASVAAFLGAFSAFFLVVLTDWRRNRRKKKLMQRQIEINKHLAEDKIATVEKNSSAITDHNQLLVVPIMRFPVEDIRRLETEVLDRLGSEEKLAIDAICYMMEAIDGLLETAFHIAKEIEILVSEEKHQEKRNQLIKKLITQYQDALVNLRCLVEMCGNYESSKHKEIISKQYDRQDYLH